MAKWRQSVGRQEFSQSPADGGRRFRLLSQCVLLTEASEKHRPVVRPHNYFNYAAVFFVLIHLTSSNNINCYIMQPP